MSQNVVDNISNPYVSVVVKLMLCVDLLFTTALFLFPMSEILEIKVRALISVVLLVLAASPLAMHFRRSSTWSWNGAPVC